MEKIWLKSYSAGVPENIDLGALRSIAQYFADAATQYADRDAFISGSTGVAMTYSQLDKLSEQVAAYFQSELKLAQGARVALMMPNLLQYPVCLFGLLRAGYVVVNVISNTAVKHVVVTGLADMMPWPKRVLGNFLVRKVKKMVPAYSLPGSVTYLGMLARGAVAAFKPADIQPNDLAFLQYTGGTTGVSKGAMLTHLTILANAKQGQVWFDPFLDKNADLISITAIPLYHIFALGTCLGFVGMGGTNVLVADPRNIPAFVKVLSRYRFVSLPAVNTLFNGLVNNPDFAKVNFSQLRVAIGGGAAVQRAVAERWQHITHTPLIEGYGLTECSPTVTVNPLDLKAFNGSIGLPVPSTEVSIRNADGKELPVGEAGELCVRGPQVMQGYWQRPLETAAVMTADGFLRTGDVAVMDDNGFLKLVDRLKDCRENLTAYKMPREIEFMAELPKSNVGKILRRELRERA